MFPDRTKQQPCPHRGSPSSLKVEFLYSLTFGGCFVAKRLVTLLVQSGKEKKKDRPLADRPTHFFFDCSLPVGCGFCVGSEDRGTDKGREGKGRKGREGKEGRKEARYQIELFFALASWRGIGHRPKITQKLVGWVGCKWGLVSFLCIAAVRAWLVELKCLELF